MPSLLHRIQSDLNAARKAQDKARTLLIGTLLAEMKNRQLELDHDLTDDDVIELIRRGIRKRRESLDIYSKAARADLADTERAQIAILEEYLPPAVDSDEIRQAVREAVAAGATNVGAVMARVMPRFKGKAEGSVISAIVREELAGKG